jgi:hypothetical protein
MQGSLAEGWGGVSCYLEVGDDQLAVRQIDVFENENVLRYDRYHDWEDYGMLIGIRFSRKPKWAKFFPSAELISENDLARVWRSTELSDFCSFKVPVGPYDKSLLAPTLRGE